MNNQGVDKKILVPQKWHKVYKTTSFHQPFIHAKREFLNVKIEMELNLDDKNSRKILRKMNKVAKILFDIERDFENI